MVLSTLFRWRASVVPLGGERSGDRVESQYKIDLEICPTPVILVSCTGTIVRTNKRCDTLFGYGRGELSGQFVEALVPEESRAEHPILRDAFFQVPTTRRMGTGRDLHGIRKDGTMIPIEIGLDPIEFDGQQMVMVSVLDIRERKNNEETIRRALNAAATAMIQVNRVGEIELVNVNAARMFGYELEEMVGQAIEILVPSEARAKHRVYRASYQNDREARSMGSGRDLFGVRKDGSEFPVEIGLTPISEDEHGATMATIIDVTDRKNRERSIEQKNRQLALLNEELLQFAYSASHDLKAPLASITGLLRFCKVDIESGNVSEALMNIDRCEELASRLLERIESMLSIAKSEMVSADWKAVDVAEAVGTAWDALEAPDMALETHFGHEGEFRTVPIRFTAILENLLTNAVKFRKSVAERGSVTIKTWTDRTDFYMTVEDDGIGVPTEMRDKIFNLFQRASKSTHPGSGVGLALVRKNATRLGGVVELEEDESSTRFIVCLPQDHPGMVRTEN